MLLLLCSLFYFSSLVIRSRYAWELLHAWSGCHFSKKTQQKARVRASMSFFNLFNKQNKNSNNNNICLFVLFTVQASTVKK